ncbi:MAG: DUF4145 domain-containing protein [Nitrospinae bacterium]|nr:DUF4145 domain-containing protein [Nitrospinota bacterium]
MTTITLPEFNSKAFHCPHCGTYANQVWKPVVAGGRGVASLLYCECACCIKFSMWYTEKMIYPHVKNAPQANPDLPESCQEDFEEARSILNVSPKGAAALLRLVIQKLCGELLSKEIKDLNSAIGELVEKGLSGKIQKALDVVRVIGNEAVHPGQIDLNDNPEIAYQLFDLCNVIVETMITQEKHIDSIYNGLPPSKLAGITQRDAGVSN